MPRPSGTFQFVADELSAHFPYDRNSQDRRSNTPATSSMGTSSNARGSNIRWTDRVTWIFLQIMLHYGEWGR